MTIGWDLRCCQRRRATSDLMSVHGGVGALNLRKPFRHEIGLVTTPLDFDPIPNDLARWLGPEFGIAHRNLVVPGYAYRLEDRAKAFPSIAQEACNLAQLGVDVVGQIGTNWAHCMEWGPEKLRSHCEQVAKAIGIPFHMTGVSLLDVLHTFGWRRVAMNNGYYRARGTARAIPAMERTTPASSRGSRRLVASVHRARSIHTERWRAERSLHTHLRRVH